VKTTILVLVVLALLVVVGVVLARTLRQRQARRAHLQERFGPEYDRAVADSGSRRRAEEELAERERRHAQLDLHPLDAATVQRYLTSWRRVQEHFVEQPNKAVSDADKLVSLVMDERGYPITGEFDRRLGELSVDHATVLDHYRAAHEISRLNDERTATTEQLRQAMLHYRQLFDSLLATGSTEGGEGAPAARPAADRPPTAGQ